MNITLHSEREERTLRDPRGKHTLPGREQHSGDPAVPGSMFAGVFF